MKRDHLYSHGLGHVTLATGILLAVGLFTQFPERLNAFVMHKPVQPHMVVTDTARVRACLADTVDTVAGRIGCGSAMQYRKPSELGFKAQP